MAEYVNKYGLVAIPVIDHEDCLVGIVTVDDAMLVLQDETTEDISIMAGVSPKKILILKHPFSNRRKTVRRG